MGGITDVTLGDWRGSLKNRDSLSPVGSLADRALRVRAGVGFHLYSTWLALPALPLVSCMMSEMPSF